MYSENTNSERPFAKQQLPEKNQRYSLNFMSINNERQPCEEVFF